MNFICPDPYAYALVDESFTISGIGTYTKTRLIGNAESEPIYTVKGEITAGTDKYISITTNGSELRILGNLSSGESLVIDTNKVTAKVVDAVGKLQDVQLHDIPKSPYEKLGFARPVALLNTGAWEAVLENAFDIIVTSEINGSDILEFKLPFHDEKRISLENEMLVQIVSDIYRIRTISDEKGADGKVITQVYAEASFYDLAFSEDKKTTDFNAETPTNPINYALLNTG